MPAKSKDQLKAMAAAAQGNSTLGIPPSVGQDFVAATSKGANLPTKVGKKKSGKDYSFQKK